MSAEYLVVSNLGALIPRHLYAPVEEVCYNLFSKLDSDENRKNKHYLSDDEFKILQNLFKIINILGILIVIFGYSYSPLLLQILY